MQALKVVLTGGPCGGKTTSISAIEEEFTEKGYHVIIVPEAATILINSGIRPFGKNGLSMYDFQKYVISLQLHLEKLASQAANELATQTIILCDRGLLDNKGYVSEAEFQELVKSFQMTQFELLNRYDLVLHLKTAADGKEEYYTTSNNGARTETPEVAREKDKQTLEAWLGHENLKIMGNEVDFDTKIANTIKEIHLMLRTPYSTQHQEKYLVESVDLDKLLAQNPVQIAIEQYVTLTNIGEIIYRKSERASEVKYTKITKLDTSNENERIVRRRNISEEEYLSKIPQGEKLIRKKRYCFAHQNQYFRLDIFDDGLRILEIEDTVQTEKRQIPNYIVIADEVSTSTNYRNSSLYAEKNKLQKTKEKKC